MLSLDDLSGVESTPNMTAMDYLAAVSEVAYNLIPEQDKEERITKNIQSPQVLDHQEKPILDFFVPRRKRSMQIELTEQSSCNGNKSMIKKAVENNSEHTVTNNQELKKMKRSITVRVEVPAPVELINIELDIEFKNLITLTGGSLESVKLVIEKRLFQTDVKPAEGRLSIPQKKMSNSFLEPEEDALLNTRNYGGKMCEMRVMLIEPSRRVSEINLRKWFMNKDNGSTSLSYVLVTYWNEVVRRNELKVGTKVQLWAFRKDTDLCFALVKLQD